MTEIRNFRQRIAAAGPIGFGALLGSLTLIPVVGLASLLLAPVGLIAARDCPMCWLIGWWTGGSVAKVPTRSTTEPRGAPQSGWLRGVAAGSPPSSKT